MCGIVGAVSGREVTPLLLEGLERLEYRGYDSAGIAVANGDDSPLERRRCVGRVASLASAIEASPLHGTTGIAHTRWATHGAPQECNAHPHLSGHDIAVVHNGIIENHAQLRRELEASGYTFTSQTDTEVLAHRIHLNRKTTGNLFEAVRATVAELDGHYALSVLSRHDPERLVLARSGCPVVIGLADGEHYVASDVMALLPLTRRFIFLEEGDVAEVSRDAVRIVDSEGRSVERPERESHLSPEAVERGQYRHFMQKEIFEQPQAVAAALEGRLGADRVLDTVLGYQTLELLAGVTSVHLVACGTSYHAALVARYQIERLAGIPVSVDIASEYRYRRPAVAPGTLFVAISQSGETADTLAAMREAKQLGYAGSLAICNVPESSLARESDLVLMTRAGAEIGVASTKAFTTQLAGLSLLTLLLTRRNAEPAAAEAEWVEELRQLPRRIERCLELEDRIAELAQWFLDKEHALFLGRGAHYPIAMEGALKLKEISYIHAEAYAAGELKHGPLALVTHEMPVIAVAPNDAVIEKLASNLQEVQARSGRLFVFTEEGTEALGLDDDVHVIRVPETGSELTNPILFTVPLQLLAYHVAILKGTDVDKPRNLAKSVTVE